MSSLLSFAILFVIDVICSVILICGFRVTVGTVERDATEEISERVHAIIMKKGHFSRRIAKAFPNYQPKNPLAAELVSRAPILRMLVRKALAP